MNPPPGDHWRWQRSALTARLWLQGHSRLTDLVVPFALAAVTLGPGTFGGQDATAPWWWWLAAAAIVLPLAWRRNQPVAIFTAIMAAAIAITAADIRELGLLAVAALIIALYAIAAQRQRWEALGAATVFEGWAIPTLGLWSPPGTALPAIVLLTGTATAAIMTGVNLQTRRAYLAALEERAARLEFERDQQAQLAVATERTRIAREVHDLVTHSLSVMVALADGAAATAELAPDRSSNAMRHVAQTGRQAIGEMRRIVSTLRVDTPDADRHPMPGIADLEELLAQVRAAGLPTRLSVTGRPHALTAGAQLAIYRTVQESLTNIRKHAVSVTGAAVRLEYSSDRIALDITDDGQPASTGPPHGGHGITGMRERVAAYGGTVEAGPAPHGGWRVHAWLSTDGDEDP